MLDDTLQQPSPLEAVDSFATPGVVMKACPYCEAKRIPHHACDWPFGCVDGSCLSRWQDTYINLKRT